MPEMRQRRARTVDERGGRRLQVWLDAVGLGLGEAAVGDGLLELCLLGRDECVDEPWADLPFVASAIWASVLPEASSVTSSLSLTPR